MADAHGCSVDETNKVKVCLELLKHMRIYLCSGHLSTKTQRKLSVTKHRCLFSFHTQLILLASGLRAERRTAAVVDFYTLISTYSRCFCTQMRSMKLSFGSQNSRSLNTTNFSFFKKA